MNKYQILKHNDGRMLAVVWPEEPKHSFEPDGLNTTITPATSFSKQRELYQQYIKACEQAIANGVPFKDQTDIQTLEAALNLSGKVSLNQPLEKMKPYPLPEGMELEIKTDQCLSVCSEQCQEHGCMGREFAFIKHESKEETCPTCGMIKNMPINFCSDSFHFKKQPDSNDETQYELWGEVFRKLRMTTRWDLIKEEFRIERIK